MGPHTPQQLQQLLPALEMLDGQSLVDATAVTSARCQGACASPSVEHGDSSRNIAPVGAAVAIPPQQPQAAPPDGLQKWALAAEAHLLSMDPRGRRYCTCKTEDAQLLACSFVIPRMCSPGALGKLPPLEHADPFPIALLLPPCRGLMRLCCCFCCCCCSCCDHSASAATGTPSPEVELAVSSGVTAEAAGHTNGCGGLCSVAAAVRTARLPGWVANWYPLLSCPNRLPKQRVESSWEIPVEVYLEGPKITWGNWKQKIDALDMSFLRLRAAPNMQSLTGLRRLEVSENKLKSIQSLLNLRLLEELLLDGNDIEALDGIESLSQLECLDISHNKISSFPSGMQQLRRLVFLCAEGNHLQQTQQLEGLPALTQLYLSGNNIQSFR